MNMSKIYADATKAPEDEGKLKQESELQSQEKALREAAKTNRMLWNDQDTTKLFRKLLADKIQEYESIARNIFFSSDTPSFDKASNCMVRSETLRKVMEAMITGEFEDFEMSNL